MTKFRAVWEDSSDTEASGSENTLPTTGVSKGKGKARAQQPQFEDELDDEDNLDYVDESIRSESPSDRSVTGISDHEQEKTPSQSTRPKKLPPSAHALVPFELNGDVDDFVHPHEIQNRLRRGREQTISTLDEDEDLEEDDDDKENRTIRPRIPAPWPAKIPIGVEPQRVHVMQQSFFHTATEDRTSPSASTSSQMLNARARSSSAIPNETRNPLKERRLEPESLFPASSSRTRLPSANRTTFDVPSSVASKVPIKPLKFRRITASSPASLIAGNEGNYHDLGLAFGKSFRVSWGPGGVLAMPGAKLSWSQR